MYTAGLDAVTHLKYVNQILMDLLAQDEDFLFGTFEECPGFYAKYSHAFNDIGLSVAMAGGERNAAVF